MKLYRLFSLYILLELLDSVTAHANKKLKYFEIIDSSDIQHQIRRRDVNDDSHVRKITLSALGKTLELELVSKPELFSRDFQAVTVDADGKEKKFNVNQNDFYKGFLKGQEKSSFVSAQVSENLLTAAIEVENDTYHVEPAVGHVGGDTSNKMIAYRDSDVIWNVTFAGNHTQNGRLCGVDPAKQETTTDVPNHERNRRATGERPDTKIKLNCPLVLVADYHYFQNMGQSSKSKTTYSMVGVINRVDELFRITDWSADKRDSYKGYGFVIKKIIIHDAKSSTGYNRGYINRVWQIRPLLEEFSRVDWSSFCLAHLFTYQDFDNGVIGLAYVANSNVDSKGGVCSQGERGMWHNTGLSSTINWRVQLLTTEADIVTAHELGHNFGSEHDVASNSECAPESGGKYIMYPASVSGRKENNKKFSSCSKKAVKAVLQAKSFCFQEPDKSQYCGNFRIEKGEKCDAGPNADDCCTDECELAKGAICSSTFEKQCCSECHFSNKSTPCSPAQPLLCRKASFCDGKSDICPKALPADEGTDCIESGKCNKNGECKPFCETIDPSYQPCLCSNDEDACFVCCKKNNVCQVHRSRNDSERIAMSNGRLCYDGVCRQKKCEKDAQDFITRLQDFFDTLADPSKFGEFLKDNIVGTVAFFSLIAWIPLSILVNRIDKRRDKQAQELASWNDSQNQDLIYQPDRRHDFDVVFKKDSVMFRDSRSAVGRGRSPNRRRGPTVE